MLLAVGLIVGGGLAGLRAARSGVLPGVTVAGVPVGGMTEPELRETLESLAEQRGRTRVVAVHGRQRHRGLARELGYTLDVAATAAAVLARGRQANPLSALADHVRAFGGETEVPPVQRVDPVPLRRWAERAAEALAALPREGRLRFSGDEVERVDPRPGAVVRVPQLRRDVREHLLAAAGGQVAVVTDPTEPRTSVEDVDAVLAEARRALSGPVRLRRSGATATLSPADIAAALRTEVVDEGDDARILLRIRPAKVTEALGPAAIAAFEREPVDARVELVGGTPTVVEGRDGFKYVQRKAARQILRLATSKGDRSAALAGEVTRPELTTADARKLRIVEQVASFTTYHACCESRVTNIHRIADIVDGVVVVPGETFSVNGYVGERTLAKGFAPGGAILDGEFVEEVGGGVSQFATTLYNAAFFGGYDIPVHKPHSYYISRYPEGREATLAYPSVDLQIRNNSPYGFLIDTSYTGESITVTLWGKEWVEVTTERGPRANFTTGETEYRENDDLPKGRERVLQEPGRGWDVTVTRRLRFPDGRTETEEIFTRYQPQKGIVERNRPGVSEDG